MSDAHLPAAIPSILCIEARLRGKPWLVRFSSDLRSIVLETEMLRADLRAVLEAELAVAGTDTWRCHLDVGGHLLSAAVDEARAVLSLGSPRLGTEAALLACLASTPAANTLAFAELRHLVDAWQQASAQAAPLHIQTLIARHGLLDPFHGEGATRYQALVTETARLAERLNHDVRDYQPALTERMSQWGLGLNQHYAVLRVHLLRFVAALPSLDHDTQGVEVARLLREMLRRMLAGSERARQAGHEDERQPLPAWIESACRAAQRVVALLPVAWMAWATRTGVRRLARLFIAGESMDTAWPALQRLHASGRDATLDQLGELVVCEAEADTYCAKVLNLVEGLAQRHQGQTQVLNAAGIERAHVSIKVSALCSDFNPDDVDGTWQRIEPRLLRILLAAKRLGVFINFDAEHYHVRDLNFALLQRALAHPELREHRGIGLAVQGYLRDAARHLDEVIAWCRQRGVRMPIRLVKGAYWDAETTEAQAHDFAAPQFLDKHETDLMFQLLCLRILECGDAVQLCIGSHNLRDHCLAHEARRTLYPDAPAIEHQTLHMTYEALSTALAQQGWAVRNYMPVGSLLVGMAYLVRRILENSSQVGVLTMAREGADLDEVLLPPPSQLDRATTQRDDLCDAAPAGVLPPFRNVAPLRLYLPEHRRAFEAAVAARRVVVRLQRPDASDPLTRSGPEHAVRSPSDASETLGQIRLACRADVESAMRIAAEAQVAWARQSAGVRAAILLRAAEQLRAQRLDFAVLVALEAGKARAEALGDVDEAIDFLQFYAREALRLETSAARQPRGVIAVVAPWNFPLAIPCGMTVAALAAGNAVILKSAEQTPWVAEALVRLLRDVGLPAGVLLHLPGDGPEVGAPLVQHDDIAGCVFTGSRAVGSWIHKTLAGRPWGPWTRLAITEMGGKNAILVTANADLDEAVSGCITSAFGHAGQKCSALSRVLVDARILPAFLERFSGAARDLQVGAALTPGTRINPVISAEDRARLREAVHAARAEAQAVAGAVLVDRSAQACAGPLAAADSAARAHLVGPVVLHLPYEAALLPTSAAQTELFGPVVHVVPCEGLQAAVTLANATPYSLTGGIYAQSQDDIEWLSDRLACGNLYVNRAITGARVAVEPFGGFRMSGTGPKAGGVDYLDAFYLPATAPKASDHFGDTWTQRCGEAASNVQAAARAHLGDLARGSERNRAIPGQDSYNRWSLPRGPVAVLSAAPRPTPSCVAHVAAALCTGNRVEILCSTPEAAATWHQLQTGAAPQISGAHVRFIAHEEALRALLASPELCTVVLDGDAQAWQALLPDAAAQPAGAQHLRQIHCAAIDLDLSDGARLLRDHLLCRSLAVYTMRHGAPLPLD